MPDSIFAQAARYGDAEAEEYGLPLTVERQGMMLDEVQHVAEQRALRIVLMMEGYQPKDMEALRGLPIPLSPMQRLALVHFAGAVLDGIYIGWRARCELEDEEEEKGA